MAAESGVCGRGTVGWRTRFGWSTRAWRNIRGLLKRKTNGRKPFSLDTLELSENKGRFFRGGGYSGVQREEEGEGR